MANDEGVNAEEDDAGYLQQRDELKHTTHSADSQRLNTQGIESLKGLLLESETQAGIEVEGQNLEEEESEREEGEWSQDAHISFGLNSTGGGAAAGIINSTDKFQPEARETHATTDVGHTVQEHPSYTTQPSFGVDGIYDFTNQTNIALPETQPGETQRLDNLRAHLLEDTQVNASQESYADRAVIDVLDSVAVLQPKTQDIQATNKLKARPVGEKSIAVDSQPTAGFSKRGRTFGGSFSRLDTQDTGIVAHFPVGTSFGGNKARGVGQDNGTADSMNGKSNSTEDSVQDSFQIELAAPSQPACARCVDRTPEQPFCPACGSKLGTSINPPTFTAPASRQPPIKKKAKRTRQKSLTKPIVFTDTEESQEPPYAEAERLQAQLKQKMDDWVPGPESHGSMTQKNSYEKTQEISQAKSNETQKTESFDVEADHTLQEGDSGYFNLMPPETQADEVSQDKGPQIAGNTFKDVESQPQHEPETPNVTKSFLGQTSIVPLGATQMFQNTQSSPMLNYLPSSTQKHAPSPGMGVESPTVANYAFSQPNTMQNVQSSSMFNVTDRITSSFNPFDSGTPAKIGWNTTMDQIKNGVGGYKLAEGPTKASEAALNRVEGRRDPYYTYETMEESQERRRLRDLALNPPRPPSSDDGFDEEEEAANRRRMKEKKRRDEVERQYAGVPPMQLPASPEKSKRGKGRGKKGSEEPARLSSSPQKAMSSSPAKKSPAKPTLTPQIVRSSQPEVIADSQAASRNEADISTQAPSSIPQEIDMLQKSYADKPSQPQATRSSARLPAVVEESDAELISRATTKSQSPSVRIPRTSSRTTPQLHPSTSALSGEVIPETSPSKPFNPDDMVIDSPMPSFSQWRMTQPTQDEPERVPSESPVKRKSNLRQPAKAVVLEPKSTSTTQPVKRTYGKSGTPKRATHGAMIMNVAFDEPVAETAVGSSDSEDDPLREQRDISPTKFVSRKKTPVARFSEDIDPLDQPIRIGKPRGKLTARKNVPSDGSKGIASGRRSATVNNSDDEVIKPKERATRKSEAAKRASSEVFVPAQKSAVAPKTRAAEKATTQKQELSEEVVQESSDDDFAPPVKPTTKSRRRVTVAVESSDVEMEDAPDHSVSPKESVEQVPAEQKTSPLKPVSQSLGSMKMPCPPYSAGYPCKKAHEHDGYYHDDDLRVVSIEKRDKISPAKSKSPSKIPSSRAQSANRHVSLDLPAQGPSAPQASTAYNAAQEFAAITSSPLSAVPSDFDEIGNTATQGYDRRSQAQRKSMSSSRDTSAPLHSDMDAAMMPPPTVSRKLNFEPPKAVGTNKPGAPQKSLTRSKSEPKPSKNTRVSIELADDEEDDVAVVKETPAPSRSSRQPRRGSSKPATYADSKFFPYPLTPQTRYELRMGLRIKVSTDSENESQVAVSTHPPKSKSTAKAGTGKLPTSKLFDGMAFAVSYRDSTSASEADKDDLVRLIRANGGRIIDDFKDLFIIDSAALATPSISRTSSSLATTTGRKTSPRKPSPAEVRMGELELSPMAKQLGFVALVGDHYTRKMKFIQALALSLPCLSAQWIRRCIARQKLIPWVSFLLAAGEAAELGGAVVSRRLEGYDAKEARFRDVYKSRAKMLEGRKVVFLMGRGKGKGEEKKKMYLFLTRALGAEEVRRVANVAEMKKLVDSGEGWELVFVDDKAKLKEAERELEKAATEMPPPLSDITSKKRKRTSELDAAADAVDLDSNHPKKKVHVVSDEFVMQSLIVGSVGEDLESGDEDGDADMDA